MIYSPAGHPDTGTVFSQLQGGYTTMNIKRQALVRSGLLLIALLLTGCNTFHNPVPYSMCAGAYQSQQCIDYSSKVACNAALQACRQNPNQVKPWLCGQCVPTPDSSSSFELNHARHDDHNEAGSTPGKHGKDIITTTTTDKLPH